MKKSFIKTKPCKVVATFNTSGKENGWLMEIASKRDKFTKRMDGQIYMTIANPGEFKGFHLHAEADYFITCLKGKMKEIIYKNQKEKEEIEMGDGDFKTVFLPKGHPQAVENIGSEPAYVLVYRFPAWNPKVKEQLNINREGIETEEAWKIINKFKKDFKKKN